MSENNYEDHVIHLEEPIVVENNEIVEQPELVIEEPPAPPREVEVQDPQITDNKPPYKGWKYGWLGKDSGRSDVTSSGENVAFVNAKFGIAGDVFTDQTAEAVKNYQREKGLRPTGKVTPGLYQNL